MTDAERAFAEYGQRSLWLDGPPEAKQRWFDVHAATTYVPQLPESRDARILELGCNRGFLLRSLQHQGYGRLTGVDLSPQDLDDARQRTGLSDLHCVEAVDFLAGHAAQYDAVIFKALLEHVPRGRAGGLLIAVGRALAPGGVALCETPNMEWYAATQERYLDLTHETGFTRYSLRQLFCLHFGEVEVLKVVDPAHGPLASAWRRWLRRVVFHAARRGLELLAEDPAASWFDCRSILAVARQPRSLDASGATPLPTAPMR